MRVLRVEELESRHVLATQITAHFDYYAANPNSNTIDLLLPIRFAQVDLVKVVGDQVDVISNIAQTDSAGNVSVSVPDNFTANSGEWFLRARSEFMSAGTNAVSVIQRTLDEQNAQWTAAYHIDTTHQPLQNLVGFETFSAGSYKAIDVSGGPPYAKVLTNAAFSILDALTVGAQFRDSLGAEHKGNVTVGIQMTDQGNTSDPGSGVMEINRSDAYSWDTILRGYGLIVGGNPDTADLGYDLGNLRYQFPKSQILGNAFAFGFANVYSIVSQSSDIQIASRVRAAGDDALDELRALELPQLTWQVTQSATPLRFNVSSGQPTETYNSHGEDQQIGVSRILMDLVDGIGGYDQVDEEFVPFFNQYVKNVKSLDEMWDKFMQAMNNGNMKRITEVGAIFEEHGAAAGPDKVLDADGVEIPPAQAIDNQSPPKFTWKIPSGVQNGSIQTPLFDKFQIKFLNGDYEVVGSSGPDWISATHWVPTDEAWKEIVDASPKYWVVVSRQSSGAPFSNVETGDYWSGVREIATKKIPDPPPGAERGFGGFDHFDHGVFANIQIDDHDDELEITYVVTAGSAQFGTHFDVVEAGAVASGSVYYGTLVFAPHETSKTVGLQIFDFNGGTTGDRTFDVDWFDDNDDWIAGTGYVVRSFTFALSFSDNGFVDDETFSENNVGAKAYVAISDAPFEGVGIDIGAFAESAFAVEDFDFPVSRIDFAAGVTGYQEFNLGIVDDDRYERLPEYYRVQLGGSNAGGSWAEHDELIVRIDDDDQGYRITAVYVDPFEASATVPDESWFEYEAIWAPYLETVADGAEHSSYQPDVAWTNGGYFIGYAQRPIYANNEYEGQVAEYVVGYYVFAIYVTPFDSELLEPDPSWFAYEAITAPNYETVADGTEQSADQPDPAWTNGGYIIGYAPIAIYANHAYEGEVPEYVTGYDVTAVYVEAFDSQGPEIDSSWYEYAAIIDSETNEITGYHVTALYVNEFYSEGDQVDASWAAYQARTSTTGTIAAGTQENAGEPDVAWTNGGYDTGMTQDDPNRPIYANYAYDRQNGTRIVGYHVTATYVTGFHSAGDQTDPRWAGYEAQTSTTQLIAAGTQFSVGEPDSGWANGGYDTGVTQDDTNQPIYANYTFQRENGMQIVGYRVTALKVEPFYGGSQVDPSWAEYEAVDD